MSTSKELSKKKRMKKIRKRSLHGILQEILNIYFVILTCLRYLYTDIVIFFDGYINLK